MNMELEHEYVNEMERNRSLITSDMAASNLGATYAVPLPQYTSSISMIDKGPSKVCRKRELLESWEFLYCV